jgi:5'-deoxynucleotidase YfbR-like HD superfamily hydrolase
MTTQERIDKVLRARQAGGVKRCHTTPYAGSYTVSEHTCQMLFLLDVLCPKAPLRLWRAILHHDLHEYYTGDLPSSVRVVDPELRAAFEGAGEVVSEHFGWSTAADLSEDERRWLKALDCLELFLWCHDELNMGNDHAFPILEFLIAWFDANKTNVPYVVRSFVNRFEWRRISSAEI